MRRRRQRWAGAPEAKETAGATSKPPGDKTRDEVLWPPQALKAAGHPGEKMEGSRGLERAGAGRTSRTAANERILPQRL